MFFTMKDITEMNERQEMLKKVIVELRKVDPKATIPMEVGKLIALYEGIVDTGDSLIAMVTAQNR